MKKLIIAGGSGYLGSILVDYFSTKYDIVILSRKPSETASFQNKVKYVFWDGKTMGDWKNEIEGADVVINLAGKSVNCRYSDANKQEIFDSRTDSTTILGEAIRLSKNPPKRWLNSSTATIYRHAEDREMTEENGEIGEGFSVEVAKKWEKVFFEQLTPQTEKTALRTSIVMGKNSDALSIIKKLILVGLGGKNASGSQFVSWIHEEDFARAVEFILNLSNPFNIYNVASMYPITNDYMMRSLRKIYKMPFGLPATKWMLKIGAFLIGTETELILKSRRVVAKRLLDSDFEFKYKTFDELCCSL